MKEAQLLGFDGPFVLGCLEILKDTFHAPNESLASIVDSAKKTGPCEEKKTVTEDGYEWHCGIYFTLSQGEIAVLFPWGARDPLLLFKRGEVSETEMESLILQWCIKAERMKLERISRALKAPTFNDSWLYA